MKENKQSPSISSTAEFPCSNVGDTRQQQEASPSLAHLNDLALPLGPPDCAGVGPPPVAAALAETGLDPLGASLFTGEDRSRLVHGGVITAGPPSNPSSFLTFR